MIEVYSPGTEVTIHNDDKKGWIVAIYIEGCACRIQYQCAYMNEQGERKTSYFIPEELKFNSEDKVKIGFNGVK